MGKWYNFDGNKLIYHMERVYEHYRDGRRIYPLHIDIGATKACNAKCMYCYGIFQKMTGDMIPPDKLVRLFEDAPGLGVKSLTLTGDGEPTLNPGVYDACEAGKKRGLDIGFATNGILLKADKLERLLKTCAYIRFNLSAYGKEAYKKIHGVDKWEEVRENIVRAVEMRKVLGSGCTIGLQMVLIPEAAESVLDEAAFAVAVGVDYFVIKQYSDPGCDKMSPFDFAKYDQMKELLGEAEKMSTEDTKIVPKMKTIERVQAGRRPYEHCIDCPLLFQVSGDGTCAPCGYLFGNKELTYGDLKTQSLKEILDSERYWKIVRYMRYVFDVNKDCKGSCRHDSTNVFIKSFLDAPEHLNFI